MDKKDARGVLTGVIDGLDQMGSYPQGFTGLLREALGVLCKPPTAGSWRPIESAPMDGTHIHVSDGSEVVEVWYEYNSFRCLTSTQLGSVQFNQFEPTHWQPMPPAPRAGQPLIAADRVMGIIQEMEELNSASDSDEYSLGTMHGWDLALHELKARIQQLAHEKVTQWD